MFKKCNVNVSILIVSLSTLLVETADAGVNEWTSQGPSGGQVYALAIDPATPSTLYAGADGGVYKSIDGGDHWRIVLAGYSSALAIDPATPSTIYAGAYKSIDGGDTWNLMNEGLGTSVKALAIDPSNPSTLYAGGYGGVYKSTDGGDHWTAANDGLGGVSVIALAIDPATPSTLYGVATGGVYKSTDGGGHWTAVNNGLTGRRFRVLAIDPLDPAILYAGSGGGVHKTTDGGNHWIAVNQGLHDPFFGPPPVADIRALAIDPSTPSTVYAGSMDDVPGLFKTTDGGASWTLVMPGPSDSHIAALAIDPLDPSTLYAGTFNPYSDLELLTDGLHKSTDGGDSWTVSNVGLSSTVITALAIDPTETSTVYTGVRGGCLEKTTDGAATWNRLPLESPRSLAIDPVTSSTIYATSYELGFWSTYLLKSTDSGNSWTYLDLSSDVSKVVIDPWIPSVLYATTSYSVYRSIDGGEAWRVVNNGLPEGFNRISELAIDPSSPTTLYLSTAEGLFKTVDGGEAWAYWSDIDASILVIDPTDSSILYAGNRGGVLKSTDGGITWTFSGTGLPESTYYYSALAIDPTDPSILYAGTDDGVFKSTDGAHWSPFNTGMEGIRVRSLVIDPVNPSTLYAGTGGQGVFEITQVDPCAPDATTLCLNADRFRVEVEWRSFDGSTGSGRVVPVGSDDSGLLWFFETGNWEVLIKVLDGCALNDRFWVFAGATSTVEYTLRVTDTATGAVREYFNPLGIAAAAITDTDAFATCSAGSASQRLTRDPPAVGKAAPDAIRFGDARSRTADDRQKGACVATPTNLCLTDNRFLVEVEWRDYAGNVGSGQVVPGGSDESGLLWFFNSDNWEMLIKVLDGCALNDRLWVFAAATTTVEYTLRVTDTQVGAIREYHNDLGTPAAAITDTDAFESCPAGAASRGPTDPAAAGKASPEPIPSSGTIVIDACDSHDGFFLSIGAATSGLEGGCACAA